MRERERKYYFTKSEKSTNKLIVYLRHIAILIWKGQPILFINFCDEYLFFFDRKQYLHSSSMIPYTYICTGIDRSVAMATQNHCEGQGWLEEQ